MRLKTRLPVDLPWDYRCSLSAFSPDRRFCALSSVNDRGCRSCLTLEPEWLRDAFDSAKPPDELDGHGRETIEWPV